MNENSDIEARSPASAHDDEARDDRVARSKKPRTPVIGETVCRVGEEEMSRPAVPLVCPHIKSAAPPHTAPPTAHESAPRTGHFGSCIAGAAGPCASGVSVDGASNGSGLQ
jgi:hypothetical protein